MATAAIASRTEAGVLESQHRATARPFPKEVRTITGGGPKPHHYYTHRRGEFLFTYPAATHIRVLAVSPHLGVLQEWQARWWSSLNSGFIYGIFPEVNTKTCHGDFLINQILTTEGCFLVHQHRVFGKSPDCECGRDQGTVSHYVYGCQIYREVRQKYFPENFFQLGILKLILNTSAKIGLKIIVQDVLTESLAGVAPSS
ncbi:hypothetical protein AVEN_69925-1 [Araneus ventricosus]|uniref:Uncharacterized protein n=1 Tax=Araneus ventricosus TaxID=182803 RepID=A0A4Y2N3X1_ARAVE|nr:hypothetical protein AVEN_69925-1 [Araneus ventricosus]